VKGDLESFKEFAESRGRQTGAWRDEIEIEAPVGGMGWQTHRQPIGRRNALDARFPLRFVGCGRAYHALGRLCGGYSCRGPSGGWEISASISPTDLSFASSATSAWETTPTSRFS
jgi:hypothetical protein